MTGFIRFVIVLLTTAVSIQGLLAQTHDNIIWASVKVQKNINDKTSVSIAPILRINEDITAYQNSSIDVALRQKIAKGWSVQVLSRTWFVPDADIRQFAWFDVAYAKKFEKWSIGSSLRMHYAIDINDNDDPDFLRWKTRAGWTTLGKWEPFVIIEPWLRLNSAWEMQRIRYEPGVTYKFDKSWAFTLIYRREETLNLDPERNFNMYVVTLSYLF